MCATLKKSSHALQRHREGRPIGAVINDLQNARSSDILKQSDGGGLYWDQMTEHI